MRKSFLTRIHIFFGSVAPWLFWPTIAFAQRTGISAPSQPFTTVDKADIASAWLDYLFRGTTLPDAMASYAAPLSYTADGLRLALGLYSDAMLILAAMLVFYHLAAMVVETAHSGIPFGRRANQIWMPIRFVLAIGLLVPVSSSLSAGQYLVVKIAEQGSALASNAWRTIASTTSGHLSGLVQPRGPNVAHLVATAVEMETCRSIYQQLYTPLDNDTVVHMAGNINDIVKLPADRFTTETWRYSNILNSSVPMCGEYRFPGYRRQLFGTQISPDVFARMAEELSGFTHSQADELQTQARAIGDRTGVEFLSPAAPIGADVHSDLASLESSLSDRLYTERRDIGMIGDELADQTLAESTNAGWLAAASFISDFVHLQESYSELVDNSLPVAQSPVFAHPRMTQKVMNDALTVSPPPSIQGVSTDRLLVLYNQTGRLVTEVHAWIFSSQLPDKDSVAPASADLRDRLNAATDPDAVTSFFAQALDAAAITHGVWGEDTDSVDTGYPFATIPPTVTYNPFAALVEFGRRQTNLASELAGLAGSGLDQPGATGPSILFGLTSLCFFLGGFLLIFVVPLLPFLRFLMAALVWGVNVFEAVVAVPIVAIAHLTPIGGGLSGSLARQAYMLWLGLLVRPIMILFGFVLGILLFVLSLAFLDAVLTPFARLAIASNTGLLVSANAGLVLLYDVLAYAAANASFKGIHWFPEQALRWTSSFVITDPGETSTSVSTGGSSPSGFPSVTAVLSPSGSGASGGTTVNISTGGVSGGGLGGSSSVRSGSPSSHSMKSALFPNYSEKAAAADLALGATTGIPTAAPSATHFGDHSPGTGTSGAPTISTNVHVTASVPTFGSSGGAQQGPGGKPSRFTGGEHEADIGGKERDGPVKDEPNETPKEKPKDETPKE